MDVARGSTGPMPLQPRDNHAKDAFVIQILIPSGAHQSKGAIEITLGIGDAGEVREIVWGEEFLRFLVSVGKVDEGKLGALGFNLGSEFAELGDRLATKGSTKVTKKDKQNWLRRSEFAERLAALSLVLLEKMRRNYFRCHVSFLLSERAPQAPGRWRCDAIRTCVEDVCACMRHRKACQANRGGNHTRLDLRANWSFQSRA